MTTGINKKILGFDISMSNSKGVNIANSSQHLVRVQLNQQVWSWLLQSTVVSHYSIHRVWDEVHDDVKVDLLRSFSLGEESMLHPHNVGVVQLLQNL